MSWCCGCGIDLISLCVCLIAVALITVDFIVRLLCSYPHLVLSTYISFNSNMLDIISISVYSGKVTLHMHIFCAYFPGTF